MNTSKWSLIRFQLMFGKPNFIIPHKLDQCWLVAHGSNSFALPIYLLFILEKPMPVCPSYLHDQGHEDIFKRSMDFLHLLYVAGDSRSEWQCDHSYSFSIPVTTHLWLEPQHYVRRLKIEPTCLPKSSVASWLKSILFTQPLFLHQDCFPTQW